jgi:alkaline phosphatase
VNLMRVGEAINGLLNAVELQTVFLASLVEKFVPVLPSYVLFPAIGAGSSTTQDLAVRCLVAVFGSIGGAAGWYGLGAAIGEQRVRSLVARYGKWLFLKTGRYEEMTASYRRAPFLITVLGQMMPTMRIFHALPAGVMRLPLGPFLLATALGASVWICVLAVAGYTLYREGWSIAQIGAGLFAGLVAIEALVMSGLFAFSTVRRHGPPMR